MKTKQFLRYAFTVSAALLPTGSAFTQPTSTAAPTPIAYVYVGTSKGINLYNAASNGRLTLVASPFKTTGLMIGSNQKYFISLGTSWVRSYLVKSNGAIGAQVSQINTQNYSGGECGTSNGAVLDHSGQYVYVQLNVPPDGNPVCNAFQTFKIASNGLLTFVGATTTDTNGAPPERNLPTFLANGKFAYAVNDFDRVDVGGAYFDYLPSWSDFTRESNGMLQYSSFYSRFPGQQPGALYEWFPQLVTADPNNHLAAALYNQWNPPWGNIPYPQLASYTVANDGSYVSTNVWAKMPYSDIFPSAISMSPDGKLVAIAGNQLYLDGRGVEVFHFNGAAEVTTYSKPLTLDPIDWICWDKANHLYALSASTGKLYVYTITPTSIAADPGSPYTVSGASGLFVVPK